MPVKSSGGVKTWLMTPKQTNIQYHVHICIDKHAHITHTAVRNHHICQTPQAGSIITYSAVFKCRLWLQIQERIVVVWAFGVSLSPFFVNEYFFPLLSYLKLDSLLINHNYFANDVHGNALWCLWDRASNSRSQELIQTCHREEAYPVLDSKGFALNSTNLYIYP